MKLAAWCIPALLLTACGTVDPGPGDAPLSIRPATLPPAWVGSRYEDSKVVLQADGAQGPLSWSLPQRADALHWLTIGESSGQLSGIPLDIVSPGASFLVRVGSGTAQAQREFSISVGCREGALSPCGVPDTGEARCVSGTRVCLNGTLGPCTADPGRPPFQADVTHCGGSCNETCSRTATNRCVGVCVCGSTGGPCTDPAAACCPGADGTADGFSCVSLQTPEHCGSCQTVCPDRPHTTRGCANSTCTSACAPGYLNCNGGSAPNGTDADGCETEILGNPGSCGACARRCPDALPHASKDRACSNGHCTYSCDGSWRNCTGAVAPACSDQTDDQDPNGCETDFGSVDTCNGTTKCPSFANGVPTCEADRPVTDPDAQFSCVGKCNTGFIDRPCNGVCKALNDPDNCGACGRSCPTIDTQDLNQSCSDTGACCTQLCDPSRRPPCGPELCRAP